MQSLRDALLQFLEENRGSQESILLLDQELLSFVSSPPSPKPLPAPPPAKIEAPPPKKIEAPPPRKMEVKKTQQPEKEEVMALEKQELPPLSSPEEEYKKLYAKIAPRLRLQEEIPTTPLTPSFPRIPLFLSEKRKELAPFLTTLAAAITKTFKEEAKLFFIDAYEQNNLYETLNKGKKEIFLILLPSLLLEDSPRLLEHYRVFPGKILKRIASIDTLLIPDVEQMAHTPSLKKEFWKTLSLVIDRKQGKDKPV